jgi:hypothetical protein
MSGLNGFASKDCELLLRFQVSVFPPSPQRLRRGKQFPPLPLHFRRNLGEVSASIFFLTPEI